MIVDPLQQRKTNLQRVARVLKEERGVGNRQEAQTSERFSQKDSQRATLPPKPTAAEMTLFRQIKQALTEHTIVKLFPSDRVLVLDYNASDFRFGVMVYHVRGDAINMLKVNR